MIIIQNLFKRYQNLAVLEKVSFNLEEGKLNYIVGPNGSGKTTLIKCILGLVKPDKGEIIIDNLILNGKIEYRGRIGYMPQAASFPENLRVEELLDMIYELRKDFNIKDVELIESFNLKKEYGKRIKNLSGGTKQKLNAAIAFLFNPEILILDEPTAGLDPISSGIIKDKIKREKRNGKTILFTSHILSELEDLAEQIIFLVEGSLKFCGSKEDLINNTGELNLERAVASLMREN